MKVAVSVRIRNGHLAEAAKQFDSQTAFAEWLGVTPTLLCGWMNYRNPFWARPKNYDPDVVAAKLELVCGVSIEEIFPKEAYANKAWLKRSKVAERIADLPIEQLLATGAATALPPAPDDFIEHNELRRTIESAMGDLRPRDQKVLRMLFGLNGEPEADYEDVGREFCITRERVRQIEQRALRLLRHPSRSKALKPFLAQ